MKCKKCGVEVEKGIKTCPSCGAKVGLNKGCGIGCGTVTILFILLCIIGSLGSGENTATDSPDTAAANVSKLNSDTSTDSDTNKNTDNSTKTDTVKNSDTSSENTTTESETTSSKETMSSNISSSIESKSSNTETGSRKQTDKATSSEFMLELNPTEFGTIDTTGLKLEFGDLLSVNNGGDGVVVVKAKITPSYSNKATIEQNYYSVCDLIQNHGFDACTELQYWAVADMTDGSESKVISFTVTSDTIKTIKSGNFPDNLLGDYVDDLYILPSLKD